MVSSRFFAPERQLALLLAGTCAQRARNHARINELSARTSFTELESFLREDGMLTLLGRRLLEVTDRVPKSFAQLVAEYARSAQRQGVYQQMLTLRLAAALSDTGVRTLPLKGPLLGERIYGEVEARVSADIDLLVGASDLAQATDVLEWLGYQRALGADAPRSKRPNLHERLRGPDGLPDVELHWRVHWYGERFSAEILRHAVPGPDGSLRARTAHELVALLLFYARDGFSGIRLLADITTWWDRFGGTLAAGELDELARKHSEIVGLLATSTLVAAQLGGLPAQQLFDPAVLSQASQHAMRLSNWPLLGSRGQITANGSLVDWFLTPSSRRRELLRRHVWPPAETLCVRWPDAGRIGPRLMRARWMLHLLLDCRRYAVALWKTRRHADWAPAPSWLHAPNSDGV
jgi:Uncharacterised nucleotidyltransferase